VTQREALTLVGCYERRGRGFLVLPQEISAVEVYRGPSEIPLNATNSLCGVVLLWGA
jgi:hypothetical protein